MRINSVIIKPIITEKSMHQSDNNVYHFKVNADASKGAITKAVEDLFEVDVIGVKTMIMPGKKKRVLRTPRYTKTSKWKKALVQLKKGQKIDLVQEAK